MKILHVIPTLKKGGAERLVLDICNQLKTLPDVEVMLVTFHNDNSYEFISNSITWKVIPSQVIPSIKGKMQIEVKQLQEAIYSFNPDVIHSHLFESEMVLSQINCSDALRVVHLHDNIKEFQKPKLSKLTSKKTITNAYERKIVLKSYKKNSVLFIAISKDTNEYIVRNLPQEFRKEMVMNAINRERFFAPVCSKSTTKATVIGSLVDKKGQLLALETIAELKKRQIDLHLDILGDGSRREELELYVKENSLENLVKFHGNVSFPEEYLKDASIYLHTAKYEPFGLVLIEAMAAGLPVVCTDGKGNRDLIIDGENGFMIWERNPVLLADKIEFLLKDEESRLNMGKKAQEFSLQFDIVPYVKKLLTLYQGL